MLIRMVFILYDHEINLSKLFWVHLENICPKYPEHLFNLPSEILDFITKFVTVSGRADVESTLVSMTKVVIMCFIISDVACIFLGKTQ